MKAAAGYFLLVFTLSAGAATPSLFIEGVWVKLGASSDETLTELRATFHLQAMPNDEDTWLLRSKSGPPYSMFGSVTIKDGRVVNVNKSWTVDNVDGAEFARLVVGSVDSIRQGSGDVQCSVSTSTDTAPSGERRLLKVSCGIRSVTVSYLDDRTGKTKGTYGSISENLGAR